MWGPVQPDHEWTSVLVPVERWEEKLLLDQLRSAIYHSEAEKHDFLKHGWSRLNHHQPVERT